MLSELLNRLTQPVRELGQRRLFEPHQKRQRAHHTAGEDDPLGSNAQTGLLFAAFELDAVAAVGQRDDVDHLAAGPHLSAPFFGQIKIILIERVFGVVLASEHAMGAMDTAGPVGTFAVEIRILNGHARGAVVNARVDRSELFAASGFFRDFAEDVIAFIEIGVRCGAKHPLGRFVMRASSVCQSARCRQLGLSKNPLRGTISVLA